VYGGIEVLLRHIPNDYWYKNKWLTEHANQIKILSLGGSDGYFGINPLYFDMKSFNVAHPSQSLNYNLFILNKFLPECDSLKFIIMPISYLTFFYSLENSPEIWRVKNYIIYYKFNNHDFDPKFNFAFYDDNFFSSIKRIDNYYRKHKTEIYCNELGFGLNFLHENKIKEWENNGKKEVLRQTLFSHLAFYEQSYNENLNYLRQIIEKSKKHNVKVILLINPTWHTYYEELNNNILNLIFTSCQKLSEQNKNVYYINLLYDKRFSDNDFFDVNHLDEFGAKKLTKILNDTLKTLN
jgi:hypothetical protein